MIFVTAMISALVTGASFMNDEHFEDFVLLWLVLLVPASILVYWYEVVRTARFGQTLGKRLWDICVVAWDGEAATVGDQGPLHQSPARPGGRHRNPADTQAARSSSSLRKLRRSRRQPVGPLSNTIR